MLSVITDTLPEAPIETNKRSFLRISKNYDHWMKLTTLNHNDIQLDGEIHSVKEMKDYLCSYLPIKQHELRIIHHGKELDDELSLDSSAYFDGKVGKCYVLMKTTAKSELNLKVKGSHVNNNNVSSLKITANLRVFQLKKDLYQKKITSLRPSCQRLILGNKVLHDHCLVGDYLLQSKNLAKRMIDSDNNIILHLSKTTNLRHEVNVFCHLMNKCHVNFSFGISNQIADMSQVLYRNYRMPRDFKIQFNLVANATSFVELHPNKTLLDYGINEDIDTVEIILSRVPDCFPCPTAPESIIYRPLTQLISVDSHSMPILNTISKSTKSSSRPSTNLDCSPSSLSSGNIPVLSAATATSPTTSTSSS